ncbi:uncharacterized protein LOC141623886 [Silene latifolia]|uniref:uncharacterized protein LOC141623886 n=1 Tax=Silene latifolia TaxID=37657 RepID=UPI003D78A959
MKATYIWIPVLKTESCPSMLEASIDRQKCSEVERHRYLDMVVQVVAERVLVNLGCSAGERSGRAWCLNRLFCQYQCEGVEASSEVTGEYTTFYAQFVSVFCGSDRPHPICNSKSVDRGHQFDFISSSQHPKCEWWINSQ